MVSATPPLFPAFCSVYSAHLRAALSTGLGSLFVQPMKATHKYRRNSYTRKYERWEMVEKTDVVKADLEEAWSLHLQE